MNIGLMLPTLYSIDTAANGVRVQAWRQADALERIGCTVTRLNPWDYCNARELDVVQFYLGGFAMHTIEGFRPMLGGLLAFAPMIDSNQSISAYRMAARAGSITWKLATVPGEFRRQALASDLVIVRSRHEHERVAGGLGIDPGKIEIVLNGMDPVNDADPQAARRAFDLPENFILHVSSYTQERKNVVRMLEAIGPLSLPVILVGHAMPGPTLSQIERLSQRFGNVRRLPFVDQQMLHNLYAACRVFCLPSTHEGTGLVALEAASLGARIVITRNGGPPDYFANLAEYVDPASVDSIRTAVQRAWDAAPSDALRAHVLKNLTWDASARSLVAAYGKHRRAK